MFYVAFQIDALLQFRYHEGWFVRQGIADAVMGQRNRGQVEQNANNVNDRPPSNEDVSGYYFSWFKFVL